MFGVPTSYKQWEREMPIKAAVFDAFGTILRITIGSHPFRRLLQEGRKQGRRPKPDDAHQIMTRNLDLPEIAEHFGIQIGVAELKKLSLELDAEVDTIQPYQDAIEAIALLRSHDIKVGVGSNLAKPYGAALKRLFPDLDAYALSYELGVIKPDPEIYQSICRMLGIAPGHLFERNANQVAMIGDSIRCDRNGPREVGIRGFHLNRSGEGDFADLVEFARVVIAGA